MSYDEIDDYLNSKEASNYNRKVVIAVKHWKKCNSSHGLQPADVYAFAKFLGHPSEGYGVIVPIWKPEVRRLLDLLTSPHGNTIFKMLEKRKDVA